MGLLAGPAGVGPLPSEEGVPAVEQQAERLDSQVRNVLGRRHVIAVDRSVSSTVGVAVSCTAGRALPQLENCAARGGK